MTTIAQQIHELQDFRDAFLSGEYPQRTALGPGSISNNLIKANSILADRLDVSDLHSITANTGDLTVTGTISVNDAMVVGTTGAIYSTGKTSYADTDAGFWMGYDSGAYKFNFGNATNYLQFDGTNLVGSGSFTTSAITIANVGGGVMAATSGNPYKTANTGARMELSTAGLLMYNSGNLQTFDADASSGNLILTGNLTVSGSAARIFFGNGGLDYLGNDRLHFDTGVYGAGAVTSIEAKATNFAIGFPYSDLQFDHITTIGRARLTSYGQFSASAVLEVDGASTDALTRASLGVYKTTGAEGASYAIAADGSHTFNVASGTPAMALQTGSRATKLYGTLYLGSGALVGNGYFVSSNSITSGGAYTVASWFGNAYGLVGAGQTANPVTNPILEVYQGPKGQLVLGSGGTLQVPLTASFFLPIYYNGTVYGIPAYVLQA